MRGGARGTGLAAGKRPGSNCALLLLSRSVPCSSGLTRRNTLPQSLWVICLPSRSAIWTLRGSRRRGPATRPARCATGRVTPAPVPRRGHHPAPGRQVLTWSVGAVANALDKLTALGAAQMVTDKPRSYRLAPAPAPDAGRRPRHQRGGCAQRRVTRPARKARCTCGLPAPGRPAVPPPSPFRGHLPRCRARNIP
jgi:hypothetical protein